MTATTAATTASLNDRFRLDVTTRLRSAVPGRLVISRAVASAAEALPAVLAAVARFDAFTPNNDPHREHDCAVFDVPGVGRLIWKIDYYADAGCEYGSERPDDPAQSYRVLTIMRAEDY